MLWAAALTLTATIGTLQSVDDSTVMDVATEDLERADAPDPNEWIHIFTTSTNTKVALRGKDMSRPDGHTFWIKLDHSADSTVKARQSLVRYTVDCRNETLTMLAVVEYAGNGAVLSSSDFATYQRRATAVIPGSAGESVFQNVCPWDEVLEK